MQCLLTWVSVSLYPALPAPRLDCRRTRVSANFDPPSMPCPHADSLLADEEAKEAKLRQERENRVNAMEMKVEAAKYNEERAQNEEQVLSHHRALVVDVQTQREKPVIAKEDLARNNKTNARELRQEIQQMEAQVRHQPSVSPSAHAFRMPAAWYPPLSWVMCCASLTYLRVLCPRPLTQAKEERRQEEARRADLIKQIRALELVPRKRESRLDPTYTPQLGLLEEMSLAELRERMLIMEEQRQEDEEQKRAKIKVTKHEKDADLATRAERLAGMRERAAAEVEEAGP